MSGRLLSDDKKPMTIEEKEKADFLKNINPQDIFKIDLQKKYEDKGIFKSGLNALIKLERFKKDFMEEGIDLFQIGKESIITDATYKTVKSARKLIATKSPSPRTLTDTSSSAILTVIMSLMVFLMKF